MARYTARYLDGYPVGYSIQYPGLAAMPHPAKMINGLALNNSVLKYIQKSTFLIIWKYLRVISILIQITNFVYAGIIWTLSRSLGYFHGTYIRW